MVRQFGPDHTSRNAQDVDHNSFDASKSVASLSKVVFTGRRDVPGFHIVMKRFPLSPED